MKRLLLAERFFPASIAFSIQKHLLYPGRFLKRASKTCIVIVQTKLQRGRSRGGKSLSFYMVYFFMYFVFEMKSHIFQKRFSIISYFSAAD